MIRFDKLVHILAQCGCNMQDLAVYTPEQGSLAHVFQPGDRCRNCYSVAKVFTMTAIGLLQEDGLLDADDRFYEMLGPLWPKQMDERWQQATLAHALTHRMGLDLPLDIDVDDPKAYPTRDYLAYILSQKLTHAPGAHYQYTDASFYLLSRVVCHVAGEKMDDFLRRRLDCLDFAEMAWSHCPMGYPMGGTGLYLSSADMVKLGALYAGHGLYKGEQILSSQWVEEAIIRGFELHPVEDTGWLMKAGMYGQGLLLDPHGSFAAAWHSFTNGETAYHVVQGLKASFA